MPDQPPPSGPQVSVRPVVAPPATPVPLSPEQKLSGDMLMLTTGFMTREDWQTLTEWVHTVLGFTHRRTGKVDDESRAVYASLRGYFTALLETKRAHPADDLGTVLASGELPLQSGQPPAPASR